MVVISNRITKRRKTVDKSDGKFSRKTISRFRNKLGAPKSKLLSGKKKKVDYSFYTVL